jgi:hypothetical protein
MSKKLFKKKKQIQIQREIKNHVKNDFIPKLLTEIEEMINDKNINEEFLEMENEEIKNYILQTYFNL